MTHNPDTLKALLARVEASTAPDRELDGAIALAMGLPQSYFAQFTTDGAAKVLWGDFAKK